MKTKEELNALKKEVEALGAKCQELTEDEVEQVFGGSSWQFFDCVRRPNEFDEQIIGMNEGMSKPEPVMDQKITR